MDADGYPATPRGRNYLIESGGAIRYLSASDEVRMNEQAKPGVLAEFQTDFLMCWRQLPNKGFLPRRARILSDRALAHFFFVAGWRRKAKNGALGDNKKYDADTFEPPMASAIGAARGKPIGL